MDKRRSELSEISSYIRNIDNEVTLILQSFQWDRNHLLENPSLALCRYDNNHRVPPDKLKLHEEGCRLKSLRYAADELLLPEPLDVNSNTLVTFSKNDIAEIIDAANINLFRKDRGGQEPEPLTLGRLQLAYSWEERRAIHDAVVSAAPACHDLLDLALPSISDGAQPARQRTRLEILAELRDMKRRRTKYRAPPKTRKYSDVLRDVIATQMEHFSEIHKETNPVPSHPKPHKTPKDYRDKIKEASFKRYDEVHVKKEPLDNESYAKERHHRKRDRSKDRYRERERDKKHDDYNKRTHKDDRDTYSSSSKERSRTDYKSSDKYRKEDRDFRRDYKEHSSTKSRTSDDKYKRERSHKSHKDERRRHDYRDDFKDNRKRIKHEYM